jgi:hypothetical protein
MPQEGIAGSSPGRADRRWFFDEARTPPCLGPGRGSGISLRHGGMSGRGSGFSNASPLSGFLLSPPAFREGSHGHGGLGTCPRPPTEAALPLSRFAPFIAVILRVLLALRTLENIGGGAIAAGADECRQFQLAATPLARRHLRYVHAALTAEG